MPRFENFNEKSTSLSGIMSVHTQTHFCNCTDSANGQGYKT